MKKTNWITIPDEKNHTPASGKAKSQGAVPVKNKLFWGVGFIVLIFAAFALLAPSQFSQLLQGNLFDTSGVSEEDRKVSLIPEKHAPDNDSGKDDSAATEIKDEPSAETDTSASTATESDESEGTTDNQVVTAEDEAVSISVEPISTPAEPVDCEEDMVCFLASLTDCKLSKVNFSFTALDKDFTADLKITGEEGSDCIMSVEFTKSPVQAIVGESFDLKLAKGDYTEEDIEKLLTNADELKTANNDSTPKDYANFLAGNLADEAASTEGGEQNKLIEDLKKQIENLQGQREEDKKTLEDLAVVLDDQDGTTHGAASDSAALPTSITSTTTIGQPPAVQPGFRVNPYKVTVSPQQVLSQNTAAGVQYAQSATISTYQQAQAQTSPIVTSGTTPETGPSEVLLLAFVVTFLGLISWRFIRTFA